MKNLRARMPAFGYLKLQPRRTTMFKAIIVAAALIAASNAQAADTSRGTINTIHADTLPVECTTDSDCVLKAFAWHCTEEVTEDHDKDGNEVGTYTSRGFSCDVAQVARKLATMPQAARVKALLRMFSDF